VLPEHRVVAETTTRGPLDAKPKVEGPPAGVFELQTPEKMSFVLYNYSYIKDKTLQHYPST
jgi:hypothetical protein